MSITSSRPATLPLRVTGFPFSVRKIWPPPAAIEMAGLATWSGVMAAPVAPVALIRTR